MLRKALNSYYTMLKERPLLVNCVTGFVVATIGDFSAQKYSQQFEITEPAIDYVRAVEMGFIRATVITPFIVLWLENSIKDY